MRLIIYTGKGGVGKTSTSAATAYRLSELGYRTILMSTDSAHSLGDSLGMPLGTDITRVKENLDALEIDIIHEMRTKWKDIQDYIAAFMLSQGMGEISAEEMAIMPGMEMISALFYVNTFEDQGLYDVVVMDTAPTGETLRLLSFPDVTNWYLEKAFPLIRKLMRIAKSTIGKITDIPIPSDEVMESVEDIKDNMSKVKTLLEDPKRTTVRLVLNPEKMVIRETMRAYTYLSLYNKNVEALIVNRVLPPEAGESEFFKDKMTEQKENLDLIHSAFDPMEIKYCQMMRTELRGEEKLKEMARMVYGDDDPAKVYSDASPMSFRTVDGQQALVIRMPFVDSSKVELFRIDPATVMVHVGSQKCNIQLPDVLTRSEIAGADFKDDKLVIRFERRSHGDGRGVREVHQPEQGHHREDDRAAEGVRQGPRRHREGHREGDRGARHQLRRLRQAEGRGGRQGTVRHRDGSGGAEALHEHGHGVHHGHVGDHRQGAHPGFREGRHRDNRVQPPRRRLQVQRGLRRQEGPPQGRYKRCRRDDGRRASEGRSEEGEHRHRRRIRVRGRGQRLQGSRRAIWAWEGTRCPWPGPR